MITWREVPSPGWMSMRRGRSGSGRRRSAGRRARTLAAGLASLAWGVEAGAGRDRVLPENAVQPPGASFEHDPPVGPTQKVAIAREVTLASLRGLVQQPASAASMLV